MSVSERYTRGVERGSKSGLLTGKQVLGPTLPLLSGACGMGRKTPQMFVILERAYPSPIR